MNRINSWFKNAVALIAVALGLTVQAGNVAKIDDQEYATLQAAFAAAKDGDTITMLADVDLGYSKNSGIQTDYYDSWAEAYAYCSLAVPANVSVTLDVNGKTIKANGDEDDNWVVPFMFYVPSGAALTIVGGGTIDYSAANWYGYLFRYTGEVTVNPGASDMIIKTCTYGSAGFGSGTSGNIHFLGGKYNRSVSTTYYDSENYEVVPEGGYYVIKALSVVCTVDGVGYKKIDAAVTAAQTAGKPIVLIADAKCGNVSADVTFNGDFKLTSSGTLSKGTYNCFIGGGSISGGIFNNAVLASSAISGGTFENVVTNSSTISNGTFKKPVKSTSYINGGTFADAVEATAISEGTFNSTVTASSYVNGGTFNGFATVDGEISGGTFNDGVTAKAAISGGVFNKTVDAKSTITYGIFSNAVTVADSKVSGGVFSQELAESKVAEGYVRVTGTDNTWTVVAAKYVADGKIINGRYVFDPTPYLAASSTVLTSGTYFYAVPNANLTDGKVFKAAYDYSIPSALLAEGYNCANAYKNSGDDQFDLYFVGQNVKVENVGGYYSLTGGTFSYDPRTYASNCIATDYYDLTDDGEGNYTVEMKDGVAEASIDDVMYLTLAKAFAAAQNGDEIYLEKDIVGAQSVVGPYQSPLRSLRLNLNGHSISVENGTAFDFVRLNLTICDDSGKGSIYSPDTAIHIGNSSYYVQSSLTVEGGFINGGTTAISIYGKGYWYKSTVTTVGGKYKGTFTANSYGSMTLSGGSFYDTDPSTYSFATFAKGYGSEYDETKNLWKVKKITYVITAGACENGSVAVDKANPTAGDTVTVTATPAADYKVSQILAGGVALSGNTFTAQSNTTVTATFVKCDYVVQIGTDGAKYESVTEALSAATAGQTVKVLKDFTATETIGMPDTYNLTGGLTSDEGVILDLGGHTITITGSGFFLAGGNLTLSNGTINAEASYTIRSVPWYSTLADAHKSKLTVKDVVLNGGLNLRSTVAVLDNVTADASSRAYYAVFVQGIDLDDFGSDVTIKGGTYIAPAGKSAVLVGNGEIEGGEFYGYGNSLTIEGGAFTGAIGFCGESSGVQSTIAITGGVYDAEPSADHILEGYVAVADMPSAGQWTVTRPVHLVSGETTTGYATLEEALDAAAASGDTIKLMANITNEQFYVAKDKSITLDLNGKTLDYEDGHTIVVSKKNAGLTITGAGTIKDSGNKSVSVGAGTATVMFDANFTGTVESLGVSSGTVTIYNGTFADDVTQYLAEGKTVVKDGDYYVVQDITIDNAIFAVISGTTTNLYTAQQKATAAWVVANGNTLKLLKGVTLATTIDIDVAYNLTLDLNGQAWSMGTWQQGIRLNKGTLTVTGEGSMLYTQEGGSCETFKTAAGTTLTIENGAFDRITADGDFVFEGGTVKNLSMFTADGATATLSGGSVTDQFTLPYTTGIDITVSGGYIANMTCQNDDATGGTTVAVTGGAIGWLQSAGTNTISGGSITNLKWGINLISGGAFTHLYYDVTPDVHPYYGETENHVSGGVFASNVYEGDPGTPAREINADCEEGFALAESGDPAYPYMVKSVVAQIGDVKYETLEAAIAAVPESAAEATTITMIADVDYGTFATAPDGKSVTCVTIPYNKSVILDLNGKTIKAGKSNKDITVILIANRGSLTVRDTAEGGKILIDEDTTEWNYGTEAAAVSNSGTFVLESGTLQATREQTGMVYALDNFTPANNPNKVTATIQGGSLISGYCAVRVYPQQNATLTNEFFMVGGEAKTLGNAAIYVQGGASYAHVVVSGGEVNGGNGKDSVYFDAGSATEAEKLSIEVTGGKFTHGSRGLFTIGDNVTAGIVTVSGGVFSTQPNADMLASGFEVTANTDEATKTAYPYTAKKFVAQIGDVKYETLEAAIAAVPESAAEAVIITMIADVEYADVGKDGHAVQIPATKNVVLDLNGHAIALNRTLNVSECIIENLGTLTVTDNSDGQLGSISVNYAGQSDPWGVTSAPISTKGNFTLAGGKLVSGSLMGSYGVDCLKGTFTMTGGTIDSTYAGFRSYSQAGNVTVNISGGKILGSHAFMLQNTDSSNYTLEMNITGGEFTAIDHTDRPAKTAGYFWVTANNVENTTVAISGGSFKGGRYQEGSYAEQDTLFFFDGGESVLTISGGIYSLNTYIADQSQPTSLNARCAEGCEIEDNTAEETKTTYPYMVKQYVAQITKGDPAVTTKYETLADAVEGAATSGDTIVLIADITSENGVSVVAKSIDFNLNGHTYTVSKGSTSSGSGRYAIVFDADSIAPSRTSGKVYGGTINCVDTGVYAGYYSDLVVEDLTVVQNRGTTDYFFRHCALAASYGSTLTVKSGTYTGDAAVSIFTSGGIVNIEGGTFTGSTYLFDVYQPLNTDSVSDSAVLVSDGKFRGTIKIEDGTPYGTFTAYVSLAGGVYDTKPAATCLAAGYEAVENDDETTLAEGYLYKVAKIEVCQNTTTGTKYPDLQTAINAADAGNTIKMLADVEYVDVGKNGHAVQIPATKNVVLDLNGHAISLDRTNDVSECVIENLGTLTVTDTTDGQIGSINVNYADQSDPQGVTSSPIWTYGSFTLAGGTLISGALRASYAVDCMGGSFTMTGGTLDSTYAGFRAWPNAGNISIDISGGNILGSHAMFLQGGSNKLTANITGGTFMANAYKDRRAMTAAYIYATDDQKSRMSVTISGGSFKGGNYNEISSANPQYDKPTLFFGTCDVIKLSGGIYSLDYYTADHSGDVYVTNSLNSICANGFEIVASTDSETKSAYPYAAMQRYTITYDLGTGCPEGATLPTSPTTYIQSATEIMLPKPTGVTATNVTFNGWQFPGGTVVANAIPAGMSGALALTATWTDAQAIKVNEKTTSAEPQLEIKVTKEWIDENVKTEKTTANIQAELNKTDKNGNMKWQNYVIGLDPTNNVAGIVEQSNDKKSVAVVPNVDSPQADTGFTVKYSLDTVDMNGTVVSVGTYTTADNIDIDLDNVVSNAFFKVNVIVQKDGTSEATKIAATNTLGVLKVSNAPATSIVAVPWKDVGGEDITVAKLVKTANLTAGDKLYVYKEDGSYSTWRLKADKTWTTMDDKAVSPETERVTRGGGAWISRQDTTQPIVLFGQADNATVKTSLAEKKSDTAPSWNIVAAPTVQELDLNVKFNEDTKASVTGDRVMVPTDGAPKNYTYEADKGWGYTEAVTVTNIVNGKTRVRTGSVRITTDTKVPAGTGFLYLNSGSKTDINW